MVDPVRLSASELRAKLQKGELTAVRAAEAFLAHVEREEPRIGAFAAIDPQLVLAQARALDAYRGTGRTLGPLHGVPVGVKDIIDTRDLATENGTALDSGRRPGEDATVVRRLREAGAIILGKTVTTELAYYFPAGTRNPHAAGRTPGGSSSGSAAAVAARMVPVAIGTQTNGSVIRPASFCGVIGFKPGRGLISRAGILRQAPELDAVGVFANSVRDAALVTEALQGFDPQDPATRLQARQPFHEIAGQPPPVAPRLVFTGTPQWPRADEATRLGFSELLEALGERCDTVELPEVFAEAWAAHRAVMHAGFATYLGHYYDRGAERLSQQMRETIEDGRRVTARSYLAALTLRDRLLSALSDVFYRYDAIVTPAAVGEAPEGLHATGDPVFCTLWTFLGLPAITLPLLNGPNGLPVGVQVVGPPGEDARLLRNARWLWQWINSQAAASEPEKVEAS